MCVGVGSEHAMSEVRAAARSQTLSESEGDHELSSLKWRLRSPSSWRFHSLPEASLKVSPNGIR